MVIRTILMLGFAALLLGGCESANVPDSRAQSTNGLDPISRDIGGTQGGAVHDQPSLSPPPIRREYTDER